MCSLVPLFPFQQLQFSLVDRDCTLQQDHPHSSYLQDTPRNPVPCPDTSRDRMALRGRCVSDLLFDSLIRMMIPNVQLVEVAYYFELHNTNLSTQCLLYEINSPTTCSYLPPTQIIYYELWKCTVWLTPSASSFGSSFSDPNSLPFRTGFAYLHQTTFTPGCFSTRSA